jgi:hypothetical protein
MAQLPYLMALLVLSHSLRLYGAKQIATQFHVFVLLTS